MTFAPNAFSGLVLSGYERATVHSGTTANATTVNGGGLTVYSGGTANSTTLNEWGTMTVYGGGTATAVTVNSGGELGVTSGAILTGKLTIGGYFRPYQNLDMSAVEVNFAVNQRRTTDGVIVQGLSYLGNASAFSITVSSTQELGTYLLASDEHDISFTPTFTITNTEGLSSSLTVGKTVKLGDRQYTLKLQNDELRLTVAGQGRRDHFRLLTALWF